MPTPPAEVSIDEPLVRSLLTGQHPDLAALPLARLDAGFDNAVWRLGERFLVRLPQRLLAGPLARNEQRWLPVLAPLLPLPVPAPVRTGTPTPDYPYHWSVVPWLEGVPGDRADLVHPLDAAERLGRFLRALHRPAPAEAPFNPFRSTPLARRADTFAERLDLLGPSIDVPSTVLVWERALDAEPWPSAPTWLHGDLHPANTVIAGGTLAGIIDFGDLCAGDPATDLAAAWMLLPAPAVDRCLQIYGAGVPVGEPLLRRSLGWAALFALMLMEIGLTDKPTYAAVGREALQRAITRSRTI